MATTLGPRGEFAAVLAWSVQPVAVALAAPAVPPLLQATLTATLSLLVLWIWTRWRDIGVFAQDATLAPGMRLGLLFSLRMALLYAAVARLGAAAAVECSIAVLWLVAALASRVGGRRRLAVVALAGLALGLLARQRPGLGGLSLAALAALAWAGQEWAADDPRLQGCGGEKFVFYQLIGAAVTLPVASVVAGENWLISPPSSAWWALLAQIGACVLAFALLWIAPPPARRRQRLRTLLAMAPAVTLALQGLLGRAAPPAQWGAAALLLAAAGWPRRGQALTRVSE